MNKIDVVGGVYRERCAFPYWNQIFGSAGRAAVALSEHVSAVCLHTLLAKSEVNLAEAVFETFGIDLDTKVREAPIEFDYVHSLAAPGILPPIDNLELEEDLIVGGETVVQFGMLECEPRINAGTCVYDPQSALAPKSFSETGSTADRLAIVANLGEAIKMTGADSAEDAARCLLNSDGAEVVVVKNGLNGVFVMTSVAQFNVPAYKSDNVFSIGSGDVFVAAFSLAWAVERRDAADAADYASKATAHYVETRSLPMISPATAQAAIREPVSLTGGNIYLAGPFREFGQRVFIDDARHHLAQLGMKVFSPVHDIGPGPAEKVVTLDLEALNECDAVFAILNGSSPGTVFEVGYARALGKPVFCVAQNMRDVDMKLPAGSGCLIHEDYVSALHQIAWRE